MQFEAHSDRVEHSRSTPAFTTQDQLSYDVVQQVLLYQVTVGNLPAVDFHEQLMTLENNLSTLHTVLKDTGVPLLDEDSNSTADFMYGQST